MRLLKWEKIYVAGSWKIEARRGSTYVLIFPDGYEDEFKKLADAKARANEYRVRNPRATECRNCTHWEENHRCDWWGEYTRPYDFCSYAHKDGGPT